MRALLYLLIGVLLGIIMFKSEVASWFRIYEMFHFKSFHMYGVIGSSLVLGILLIQLIKRLKLKSFYDEKIVITPKEKKVKRYLLGGIVFGLGWAIVGAFPVPMFTLICAGYPSILIVIFFALLGTFLYGLFRSKVPH